MTIVDKIKFIEKYKDIVALDITLHPFGQTDYVIRGWYEYCGSYTFTLILRNKQNNQIEEYWVDEEFLEKHDIVTEDDIKVITSEHGAVNLQALYLLTYNEHFDDEGKKRKD